MRGLVLLVAVAVVGLAGMLVYTGRSVPGESLRSIFSGTTQQAAATVANPAQAAVPAKASAHRQRSTPRPEMPRGSSDVVVDTATGTAVLVPQGPIPAEHFPPPFPTTRNLKAGLSRTRLVTLYGEPTLRTSTTYNGIFLERYVYVKPDRSLMTVAVLRNGAVVSTYSTAQ